MGTKKTMLIISCALVMVMAMSSCAFAAAQPFGQSSNSYSWVAIDKDITVIGIDYTDVDVTTTLDNSNNKGIILQNSDKNDIIAIDDITLDVCILTAYSGNVGSFNETYIGVGNTTYTNVGNTFTATTTIVSNFDSFNNYDVDLNNVGNSAYTADFNYADYSTQIDVIGSFNGNTLVNYQDQDFIDYDDNDGVDADIWALLNLNI
jgi:hypothetical protein